MILAAMLERSEDSLICDLAETYHIYEMRSFRASYIATLAAGLREDSRVMMLFSGNKIRPSLLLQAASLDKLALLWWAETKDGQKNRNRPESVVESLTKENKQTEEPPIVFESAEDFNKTREEMIRRINNGN
jgi:hypothetical protein